MDTLFDKISMLISSKFYGKPGRSFTPNNSSSSSQRRLRQTVYDLLRTEAQSQQVLERMQERQSVVMEQERQAVALDQQVDGCLLAGDEENAAALQQQLNLLRQRTQKAKMQLRHTQSELQRLQALRDQLEVKMTVLGLNREVLDEYIRRYQEGQTDFQKETTWRVLDPEEL